MSCCEYGSTNFQEMKKTMGTEILRVHTGTRELQTAVFGYAIICNAAIF